MIQPTIDKHVFEFYNFIIVDYSSPNMDNHQKNDCHQKDHKKKRGNKDESCMVLEERMNFMLGMKERYRRCR